MKKIIILFIGILLYSCKPIPSEIVWEKEEQFEVIGIDPPKHFYLDLKRVSDGKVFHEVYISKHCNDMCLSLGQIINVKYGQYKRENNYWIEFDNYEIYEKYCGCNN